MVQVDGKQVRVIETHSAVLPALFNSSTLRTLSGSNGTETEALGAGDIVPKDELERLKQLVSGIKSPYSRSILIVPPHEYLSLNVELPFDDAKNIGRVLDMEVQDLVPFDLAEFHLQHQKVAAVGAEAHDIHVAVVPKFWMKGILKVCRDCGLEPFIICTPASASGAAYFLRQDSLSKNSAVVLCRSKCVSLCIAVDGAIRTDRVIGLAETKDVFGDLKVSLTALERRYQIKLDGLYLMGNSLNPEELQHRVERKVEVLKVSDLVRFPDEEAGFAALPAVFAQDFDAPPILANLRAREYAYNPQLTELLRGLRALVPYFAAFLLLLIVLLSGRYYVRERRISQIEEAMRRRIMEHIPSLPPQEATVDGVMNISDELSQDLTDLGSFSSISPLEAFVYISEDLAKAMKKSSNINLETLDLLPDEIKLTVQTPGYRELDSLERSLKKRGEVYCKVQRDDNSRIGTTTRNSKFNIKLCKR